MWLAHALTLARLPLLAVLWVADSAPVIAAAIAGAALSDLFDGPVARRAKASRPAEQQPAWWRIGGWLDPLVDKVFVVGALGALAVRAHVAPWELVLVAAREVLLVPLLAAYLVLRRARRPLSADAIGKVTTAGQLITLAILAVRPAGWLGQVGAAACAVLGVATVAHYIRVTRGARELG